MKSHIAAFEAKTGIKVAYSNSPWAQYRESMITKFIGKAPIDTLWVSDSWLPEWAEAGWIAPVDQYKSLTDNSDVDQFCVDSMTYKGKQYGNTYYSDYMAFIYNAEMLDKAGIKTPPQTWAEVASQAKTIKDKGLAQWPVLISMAQESWLIEFMTAMVYSNGGRFVDDKGNAVMQDPAAGAAPALRWLVDAVQKQQILSPSCVESGELAVLKAFSSGEHAFGLIPKYRLRTLNDPAQSKIAGNAKIALMPAGEKGSHATVGWMRFYGMTPRAQADATRAEDTVKLMEWFGGKADGEYKFQKMLFKDVGSGFGVKSLFRRSGDQGSLRLVWRRRPDRQAAVAGAQEGRRDALVRRVERHQRYRVAAGHHGQDHGGAGVEQFGREVDRAEEAELTPSRGLSNDH